MQKIVLKWLKSNNLPYDKIFFVSGDKVNVLTNYKINVMIEDNPENILTQSQNYEVLCFDAKYNHDINLKNVTRVYSWFDILDKIIIMNDAYLQDYGKTFYCILLIKNRLTFYTFLVFLYNTFLNLK